MAAGSQVGRGTRRVNPTGLVLFVVLCGCGQHHAPDVAPVEITTPSGAAMILLPGGEFTMGSASGADDESPPHRVTISAFVMDKFEVTQEMYAALEIPDPSHFKDPKRPVEQVRWSDAALFCNQRSLRDGLEPCYDEITFECDFTATGYRLPTEAEWEYAARAGMDTTWDFGDSSDKLGNYAWFEANSTEKTDLVGRKRSNRWGFHDLYGNVLEWCHDAYSPSYYSESPGKDPRGPASGDKRVMRGGAWNSSADTCRATARFAESPGIADACFARDTFGFRCVRRPAPQELALLQPK